MDRRLAAILAADVAGYSRLMSRDEEQATRRLAKLRQQLKDRIDEFDGKMFGEAGDGFVAEFASPVNAVRCAVEVQRDIGLENRELASDQRMLLRIGIHLADVILENETLLGDGVNIAARIEASGTPGEVHVSGQIFDQVAKTSGFGFKCLGAQHLKNIDGTTTVYAVAGEKGVGRLDTSTRRDDIAPPLPDKPSIAVLPFTNMSGDAEQGYFSDGITEDIITELSRFKSIFVISRHASFAYRGQRIDPRQVGRELGVRYVLEGSIRRMGPRVRITAQLIEAETNNHLWAERYDAESEELFSVQDDLVSRIVATIAGQIKTSGIESAKRQIPGSLDAYDCLLKGIHYHEVGGVSKENAEQAVAWFDRAIELSPDFARAYAWRACARTWHWIVDDPDDCMRRSELDCQRALGLDPNEAEAHRVVGAIRLFLEDYQGSEYHHLRAMELNPNDAYLVARSAVHYLTMCNFERALDLVRQAMRQDPFLPDWCREEEVVALYLLDKHKEAQQALKGLAQPSWRALAYGAANLACLNDKTELKSTVAQLLRSDPDFAINGFLKSEPKFVDNAITEKIERDLVSAGLADGDDL